MDKKTAGISAAVFVFGLFLGFVLGGRQTNITGTPQPENPGGNGLAVSIITNNDTSAPLYKLSIEYPQFPSAPATFNESIKNFVDTNLAGFKQTVQENWDARQATRPSGTPADAPSQIYYFSMHWEPAQLNTHYISFILRMAAFVGGANEDQEVMTFNYDLAKHSAVSLSDFFPGKADYLTTVSQLAREQLGSSLKSAAGGNYDPGTMLSDGTTPTMDNFKNFVFNDDVITIYFPKYQVAPGVFGEQHIGLTRSTLGQ